MKWTAATVVILVAALFTWANWPTSPLALGLRNGSGWIGRAHRWFDWTHGCVAMTNAELDELWRAVPDGTPIELRP